MRVGTRILEHIKESGTTQVFISQKTGISPAKLNLSLNGKRRMSLEEYAAVCFALGVGTDRFLSPQPLGNDQQAG